MTGWRESIQAGTLVSPANTTSVPCAVTTSQSDEGTSLLPPDVVEISAMPSGTPRIAPGSAASTWGTASPRLT